jgi:predicted ester cyclase
MNLQNMEQVTALLQDLDQHRFQDCQHYFHPDSFYFYCSEQEPLTFRQSTCCVNALYTSFPDLQHAPEDIIASEDLVVVRYRLFGTHTQPYKGILPTNKKVNYAGISIYEFYHGRIRNWWCLEDNLSLLSQLLNTQNITSLIRKEKK